MELIAEIFFDFLLEGIIDLSKNESIPKIFRYFLIGLVILFFTSVIGLILFTGILVLKKSLIVGILFILLGIFLLVMSILRFREVYMNHGKKDLDL